MDSTIRIAHGDAEHGQTTVDDLAHASQFTPEGTLLWPGFCR